VTELRSKLADVPTGGFDGKKISGGITFGSPFSAKPREKFIVADRIWLQRRNASSVVE